MALKATIFKVNLNISDLDQNLYFDTTLTLARHPSETDQRMIVRLLAWLCNANEALEFSKGLCTDDEPTLALKTLSNEIEQWIEVGLPDEKRLKKASPRSKEVLLYTYGGRNADLWLNQNLNEIKKIDNLTIWNFPDEILQPLIDETERTMQWQVTITDSQLFITTNKGSYSVMPELKYPE